MTFQEVAGGQDRPGPGRLAKTTLVPVRGRRESEISASVRDEVATEIFPFVRMIFSLAGGAAVAASLALEWSAGRATPSIWVQAAVFVGACVLTWLPLRREVIVVVMLAGICALGSLAFLSYGPMGGAALILVGAALVGGVFFGRRGASVVGSIGLLLFVASAAAVLRGWVPVPLAAAHDPAHLGTWLRTGISILVVSAGVVAIFERLLGALERLASRIARSRLDLEAAEREREHALGALAGSQRLASLGQLAAGAAHDFRNALAVIQSCAAEIGQQPGPARLAEAIADIERATRDATRTATQLVTFGRPAAQGKERCDPCLVATEVARTLDRVLPKSVVVRAEADPVGEIDLDAATLSQALLNLALNARDAMPSGGHLSLRVGPGAGGAGAVIEVGDTGSGMDAGTVSRATEPFFTTKASGQGSGLGLAMAQDVVTRAGGALEIDSARGRGTTVRLRFPESPATPAGTPRDGAPHAPSPRRR